MKLASRTVGRASVFTVLVFLAVMVPLLHAAHHHGADVHDDSTMHATCVLCSFTTGTADGPALFDIPTDCVVETLQPCSPEVSTPALLITTEATRGPPSLPA